MAENLFGHGRKDKSKAPLQTFSIQRGEIKANEGAGLGNCPKKFGND